MGAPCFDITWRMIGVHVGSRPQPNGDGVSEGLAVEAIIADLEAHGVRWTASEGLVRRGPRQHAEPRGSLDEVVRGISVEVVPDPDGDAWATEPDGPDAATDRWAWAEAAAVVVYYDPARLVPTAPAPLAARVTVQLESRVVRDGEGKDRWVLPDLLRIAALR